jgi:hypothetical protein
MEPSSPCKPLAPAVCRVCQLSGLHHTSSVLPLTRNFLTLPPRCIVCWDQHCMLNVAAMLPCLGAWASCWHVGASGQGPVRVLFSTHNQALLHAALAAGLIHWQACQCCWLCPDAHAIALVHMLEVWSHGAKPHVVLTCKAYMQPCSCSYQCAMSSISTGSVCCASISSALALAVQVHWCLVHAAHDTLACIHRCSRTLSAAQHHTACSMGSCCMHPCKV